MADAPDFIDVEDLVPPLPGSRARPADASWPESSTLPQRALGLILTGGVEYYAQPANQSSVRRAMPFLEAAELLIVEQLVRERPLKVVHNFPKSLADLPTLAIILGKEETAQDEALLDHYATIGEDTYGDSGWGHIDVHTVGFNTVITLLIVTQNPDVTTYWYELVKFILIQSRTILARLGIDIPRLSGADIETLDGDKAELVYMRELTLSFRTRQVFAKEAPLLTYIDLYIQENLTREQITVGSVSIDTVLMGEEES